MRLVAVCKVLNEADIIEAFARHTAHYATHQLFLDNGSIDGTVRILRELRREGLSLTILQNGNPSYNEAAYNTHFYHHAIAEHGADWVAFLDADEFIDDRAAPLLNILENTPEPASCVRILLTNYHPTGIDDQSELIVPSRVQWVEQRTDVPKVIVRGNLANRCVVVQDGAHGVQIDNGRACPLGDVGGVHLAHYPERSPCQVIVKFVRGWAKVLATGSIPPTSTHYRSRFELLRDQPQQLLAGEWINKFRRSPAGMEHDPIAYRGTPLRYTEQQNEWMRATSAMVGYLETLSREHGRLLDECPGAREMTEKWAASLNDASI